MRSRNARTRAVALGSLSGSAARSAARSSFARFRLVEVTMAGWRAQGDGGLRSLLAGVG